MGGFLFNLCKNKIKPCNLTIENIKEYGDFAGKVAACCIGKRGAIDAMPGIDEII